MGTQNEVLKRVVKVGLLRRCAAETWRRWGVSQTGVSGTLSGRGYS